MSLPYASINDLSIYHLPLQLGIDAYHDVYVEDIKSTCPDGVYRLISRTFLRWLDVRLKMASAAGSGVAPEALEASRQFFSKCCEISGLTPTEKTLPSGYSRPTRSSSFEFRRSFCIWDNTTPQPFLIDPQNMPSTTVSSHSEHDVLPGCPRIYPVCRGAGIETQHYRFDQIPHQAQEYMMVGGSWLPIPDHWKLAPNVASRGAVGIWCAPGRELVTAKITRDDLF